MNRPARGRERETSGERKRARLYKLSYPTHEVGDRRNGMVNGTRGFKVVGESVVLPRCHPSVRNTDRYLGLVPGPTGPTASHGRGDSTAFGRRQVREPLSGQSANRGANGQYLLSGRRAVTTETDSTRERDRARGNRGIPRDGSEIVKRRERESEEEEGGSSQG